MTRCFSRRTFVKRALLALAALSGLPALPVFAAAAQSISSTGSGTAGGVAGSNVAGSDMAGSNMDGSVRHKNIRWGLVFFVKKIEKISDYYRIITACHNAHNVPDIAGQHAIKWIWSASCAQSFAAEQTAPEVKNRRFLLLCNHCANPPCVRLCPTGASFKRADGLVLIDHNRCVGCRTCMSACPYGARSFNFSDPLPHIKEINPNFPVREKGVAEKCNFCVERLAEGLPPYCVKASNGAIIAGDLAEPDSEVSKALRANRSLRRKVALGTEPNVYYIV